ncbi:hypothetical protein AB1Y20_014555 [Prymnesium parvum]|uniref:[RNA-polymerase]-subunit kinase n=1 Tax=Prymnesium parvum TaxID=97485 RepID=A0AB34IDQ9_PRYPA
MVTDLDAIAAPLLGTTTRSSASEPRADYDKIEQIGEGTFGVVSKAIHLPTQRVVAIKKLRSTKSSREAHGIDLATLREIMLLQELRHPNVIELIEVFYRNQKISLVFEHCTTDLEAVIKDGSAKLESKDIQRYMLGSLRGLAHCHANWIIHRDLKPGNLLLDAEGSVKLADFGLARFFGSPERKLTGQVVTRWYRAPELLFGAKFYGAAVDMWSMGCILAELLLRVPFLPGNSDIDQLSRTFTALGTPDEELWPGVSSLPDYVPFRPMLPTPMASMFPAASSQTISLLQELLRLNPGERVTVEDALKHRYFQPS